MNKMIYLIVFISMISFASAITWDNPTYYDFNSSTGSNAEEIVLGIHNGTLQNMENGDWISDGINLNALNFSGAGGDDEWVNITYNSTSLGDLSLSVWIRVSDNTTSSRIVSRGTSDGYGFTLGAFDTGGFKLFWTVERNSSTDGYFSDTTLDRNTWYHVVATYKNSTNITSLWLDGVLQTNYSNENLLHTGSNTAIGAQANGGNKWFVGAVDELSFWDRVLTPADISELYNGGTGEFYPQEVVSVDLDIPSNNSFSIDSTIAFQSNVSTTAAAGLVNSTIYVWYSNNSIFNITTEDITGSSNVSNISVTGFSFPNVFYWNVYACDVDSLCAFSLSNNTLNFGYEVNSNTFTTPVGDLTSQNYILNLTTVSGLTFSGGTLIYNGAPTSAVSTSDGVNTIFTATRTTPAVGSSTNLDFFWNFTLSNGDFGTFSTENQTQTVTPSQFALCNSTLNTVAVNYSIFDEELLIALVNNSFEATFTWSLGGTSSKNASFDLQNNQSYAFCISPNATFQVTSELRVGADGYSTRKLGWLTQDLSNNATNISLYLLNSSLGTDVIIELKDVGLVPVENYTIEIQRRVESTGEYILVENDVTDVFGQIVARLVENEVRYRLFFYDTSGTLVKRVNNAIVACQSSPCTQQFIITDDTDLFADFDSIAGHTSSLTFDNNTNVFSYVWVDNTGDSSTHRLLVERVAFNGTTVVCNTTSSSSSDLLSCNVGDGRFSYRAQAFRTVSGDETRLHLINNEVGDLTDTYGLEGLYWSFILSMVMLLVGRFYPPVGVALYLFGVFLLGVLDIAYINPAIIIAELVVGGIFIWAFRG